MSLGDFLRKVGDLLTGDPDKDEEGNIRPASEDPLGDPADQQQSGGERILPASQDPYGDPADQGGASEIRPASEDPLGDPADQEQFAGRDIRPASEDPLGDPADQEPPRRRRLI
jgi:hypothetical protein